MHEGENGGMGIFCQMMNKSQKSDINRVMCIIT